MSTLPNACVISVVAMLALAPTRSVTAQGTTGGKLSDRTELIAFFTSRSAETPPDLVLILRGQPSWMNRGNGSRSSGSSRVGPISIHGEVRPIEYSINIGRIEFACIYDLKSRTLRVWGEEHRLGSTNVLLIDRIDHVGGRPVIARRLALILPSAAEKTNLAEALLKLPELQEFVR